MRIYFFDEKTNELTGEGVAQESPREPGIYLLPKNSTKTTPPEEKIGYARVFAEGGWKQIEDHRQKRDSSGTIIEGSGTPYWIDGDGHYSPARYMLDLGPLPDGALLTRPKKTQEESLLENLKNAKSVRAFDVSQITVEVDGMTFDGDETSQDRMTRAITMFTSSGLPEDTTTSWVLADNTVAQVTIGQLTQALLLAGKKQTELWTKPYEI